MIGTIHADYVEIAIGALVIQLPREALPDGLRQGDRVTVQLSLLPYHGVARKQAADLRVTLAWGQ